MPYIFNHLNQKLETAEIEESEQQAKKIAALGKQLKEDPAPVERLSSFIDKYGWLPKEVLAGLGISSLTNPQLILDDQEPFVADLINAWTKNSQENASRLGSLLKGGIRTAFVGFDAAAERLVKRPIQAAGGVYHDEQINPTVALLDIIPGLGFTLAKGFGMTDMSYSEFFNKRDKKKQELGATVGEAAVKKLVSGEKINLGTGFFGNSTLAEDTEVYKEIEKQTSNPDTLENARKLIQDQLGEPISVQERKRVNANTFTFDDGSVRPISPGLLLAQNVLTPEEKGYNLMSGLVDTIFTIGLDPANLAGGYFAKAGRLKKSLNPNVVKSRFITGRLARKMVHVPNSVEYLNSPAVRELANIGAKSKDIKIQRSLTRDQIKDPVTIKRMVDAENPNQWIKAIEDYGLKNIDKRFEKSSKFHIDYKDGEKLLKSSPKHMKQRRVIEALKEKPFLMDDTLPTGNLKDYSIRVTKNIMNSPVARAMKDLPSTTLNAGDLSETAMLLDDWVEFIGAPVAYRNALNKKMVSWIQEYNFRKQISHDYNVTKILDNEAIELIKESVPAFRNVNLKRDPSVVSIRSKIQDLITGDNQMSGITWKDGKRVKRNTIFGWFDEWAETQNLPPMALKMTRDLIANTNEGKRAYLVDRIGNPNFSAGSMTGKGTDAIIRGVPEETLQALPTALKLTEYLSYAITMPDPRELARYLGNVRNSFAYIATRGLKDEFPRGLVMADKRPGELTEAVAEGFIAKTAKSTRNALKYKITEDGIEQATLLKVLNRYMTKAWKPLALLRFAWTLRVVGEEQMRMWASDLDNVFTSPLSYFSYWFGDNAPMKTLAGNMQNAYKYKSAMSKGHGGFIGINSFGRNRTFETVDKSSKKYGSYLANNHLLYINDSLAQDIFPVAVDLTGKKLNIADANVVLQRASSPLNKKQIKTLIGDDQQFVLDKSIKDFMDDVREGIVVSDVQNYSNLDKVIETILRREMEYFTQGFRKNMDEPFRGAAIISKLMKTKSNSKIWGGFSKNQVMEEMTRVLDDYAITHSPTVKEIPLYNIPKDSEVYLDTLLEGKTSMLRLNGDIGDIIGIPNKKGDVSYFKVDKVHTLKNKVSADEEFALTLDRATDMLISDGYTTRQANTLLGPLRLSKELLTATEKKAMLKDLDDILGYVAVHNPITRVKRQTGKTQLVIEKNVFGTSDGIQDLAKFTDETIDSSRLQQLNYLAASNSMFKLNEVLKFGFGKSRKGEKIRSSRNFYRIKSQMTDGVIEKPQIIPTKLGFKVLDTGLVDKAEDLVQFSKNGSGLTKQAIDLMQEVLDDFSKKKIKLLKAEDLGAEILTDMERGNKLINNRIDSLLRQEQLVTLIPTEKKSFNFGNDLVEQKVTQVISGGQTGADIAGLKIAKKLGIPTGGRLTRRFMTEDGPNYSLQGRFGLQPDNAPLDSITLSNKGIIRKGKFSKAKYDKKRKLWTDVDSETGEEFVLNLQDNAAQISALEYRSRAIKNVDNAQIIIIATKAGVESTGTKSTFEYAVNRRWGKGKDKTGFIFLGDDLANPSKANHRVYSNHVSNARTNYSKNKDVIVINIEKFIADGYVIDPETMRRIDNLLSYYDNPIVNIAGPSETRITPLLKEQIPEQGKRKYVQDEVIEIDETVRSQKESLKLKNKLKSIEIDYDELQKSYSGLQFDLHNILKNMQEKGSKLNFENVKINVPFETKALDAAGQKAALKDLEKTWVVKDRTGKTLRKLSKGELEVVQKKLKQANTLFRQMSNKWNQAQTLKRTVDADSAVLPTAGFKRLQLEDSELLRPFENQVSRALEQILSGTRKTRFADTFDNLVSKYTKENREYFNELASDSFDNARGVKTMVYNDDLLIESQMKSYLADVHLLAGGDYDVILKNKNKPEFSFKIEEGKTVIKSSKDPNFAEEVPGINKELDKPVTITIDGKKKTFKNLQELQEGNNGLSYEFLPDKSIPTNPMGVKKYSSLEEMYEDGYYFDYNITKTGDTEMLRVMAGIDPFVVNFKGQMVSKFVTPNMTQTDRRAYIKWLETKKHLGPTRVKGARTTPSTEEGFATALDQSIEYMFDLFMSGPTNRFSRSPAFYQFYMDKMRQLAAFSDEVTKKQVVDNFEQAWNITKNESIDVGLVRRLFDKKKELWFDKNFRQEFLADMQVKRIDDVFELKDIPKEKRYNIDVPMAPSDNIYGETTTTMDLIRSNKRRSTTMKWKTLPNKGDIISFSDKNNNRILVKVTDVKSWKDIKSNPKELLQWSKDEGFTMTYGLKKAKFNKFDPKDVHKVNFEQYTEKIYTTFDEIDTVAKAYALEETKRLLYDLDKRGQITDALRLVFPFGEAYKEILTTQFRLLKNNPQKLRKATIGIEGARVDSIFGSDPSHNEGFFAKDPMTGEEMYNFTDPGGIISGMIVGDTVDNTGVRLNLKGYTRNLNMLTTTILPGVGPVVQIPMAALSSATEFTKLSDFLFPYGRPEVRSGLKGIIDIPKAFAQASIPSYMRKVFAVFGNNPAGRDETDGFDPGSDPAGALASTTKDILKVRAYAGTADFSSISSQNAEIKSAVRAARGLTAIRAAVQFIWFTGAEPRYEAVISSEDGQAFLDPAGTEEIDPQGRIVSFNQLVQAYYKLYSMAQEVGMGDKDPQFLATQSFITLFGTNPIPLLIRKTREIEPYPLGEVGLQWARDNGNLFAVAPNTAMFAAPNEPFDEFSIRAWRESITKGKRVGLTPEQWIHLNNQANGRIAQQHVAQELENNEEFALWNPMQKNIYMQDIKGLLYNLFPGFGSQLTAAGPTDLDTKLRELRTWKNTKGLGDSDAGTALEKYFKYRDSLMVFHKLKSGNPLTTIDSAAAIGIRNSLRLFAQGLIIQHPEFRLLYSSILARELEEDERSVPDGFRVLGN